jgi:hypothetical protein
LLLGLLMVLVSRCYSFLVGPTLRVEDGAHVFGYFYSERDWSTLFRFKAGYIPFGPNLMGFLSVRLPVEWSPYALTILPFIQSLAAFALFFSRDFRACVRSDAVRFTVCLALAIAPIGQFHLLCHTDFSIWSALLIVCWLSLLPAGDRLWKSGAVLVVGQLFVWSNPLSFVAAPVHAARLVIDKGVKARSVQALWLGAHALHLAFGIEPGHASALGSEALKLSFWQELATRTWWHIASRACFRVFFGPNANVWAEQNAAPLIHAFAAAFALSVLLVAWRGPRHGTRFVYLALGYLVIALTAAIVVTKSDRAIAGGYQRYHYVQALLLLTLGVLLAAHAASHLPARVERWLWPAFPFLILAPLAWTAVGNMKDYQEPSPENAERIRECTRRLAELEREHQGRPCGFKLQCRKVRDWTISIRTPRCQ